jgi:uncharacterized protein (TIGR03067 family)
LRRIVVKLTGFLAVLAMVSIVAVSRGDEAADDAKKMEGTWLPKTAEFGGQPFPDEIRKMMKLVLKDGEYTVTVGDKPDRGKVKLDSSAKPKAMDVEGTEGPNKGKTLPAIYKLSGDTLTICYNLGGKERPTEFKTKPGTKLFLVTYERK